MKERHSSKLFTTAHSFGIGADPVGGWGCRAPTPQRDPQLISGLSCGSRNSIRDAGELPSLFKKMQTT